MCEQMFEIIFVNGGKATIAETPMIPKYIIEHTEDLEPDLMSTACYRGYLGTWEVKNSKLYLKSIEGGIKLKNDVPVFAEWFTGELHIPGTMYSFNRIFLEIKNGVVINLGLSQNLINICSKL